MMKSCLKQETVIFVLIGIIASAALQLTPVARFTGHQIYALSIIAAMAFGGAVMSEVSICTSSRWLRLGAGSVGAALTLWLNTWAVAHQCDDVAPQMYIAAMTKSQEVLLLIGVLCFVGWVLRLLWLRRQLRRDREGAALRPEDLSEEERR